MKDCRFLLPFVDELRKLYPDHKIEWVRDDTNTEYERINIDDKTFIYTEIGHTLDELGKDKVVSASIVVEFQNLSSVSEFMGWSIDDPYSVINERINELAKNDEKIAVARNLDLGNWYDIHPLDKRVIGTRAIDETLRLFYGKDIKEPIKLINHKFNDDGSVTLEFNRTPYLINGNNGFEVSDGTKYSYECNVVCENNVVTVSASYAIQSIRYGYTCKMNSDIMNDVSKMVTIFDSDNNPLDLFVINK
jgi:hypothetical protein